MKKWMQNKKSGVVIAYDAEKMKTGKYEEYAPVAAPSLRQQLEAAAQAATVPAAAAPEPPEPAAPPAEQVEPLDPEAKPAKRGRKPKAQS